MSEHKDWLNRLWCTWYSWERNEEGRCELIWSDFRRQGYSERAKGQGAYMVDYTLSVRKKVKQ